MRMVQETGHRRSGELPAETTSFIGRQREIAQVAAVLDRFRLVTLTGPGGVGKTRTAVRAAHRLRDRSPDGVHLVPLSALTEPELLPNTVAAALDLPEQAARPAMEVLTAYLEDKNALIVLDTCEHLIDACALLADELLRTAPDVRLIATSRQPLDIEGEHVLPIPPLSVEDGPDAAAARCGRPGARSDALQLFADRTAAAVPGFTLTDDNLADATSLCRRLDGIPLAIELAVSRLRALSLEEILGRLDRRFLLLTGGRRTTVPRHQTLRTTIGWSHALSTPQERVLWTRLSVFAGEFSLEAAEGVCADERTLPAEDVLDALFGLVEKSVVQRVETEVGTRYRMLDTIREFGRDQLAAGAEEAGLRKRHAAYFLDRAGQFDAEWTGDAQLAWVRRLRCDQANLRTALETCVSTPGLAYDGLCLATRLWGYWQCTGLYTEGRYWLRRALECSREPTPERVKALWLTSWYLDVQGERGDNWALLDEAEEIAARAGDARGLAWTLAFRHHARYFRGTVDGVIEGYDDARRRMAEAGDEVALLITAFHLAFAHFVTGGIGEGIALCDESLRRNAAHPQEHWSRSWALWVKSVGLWLKGEFAQSIECCREGIHSKAALRDTMGIAHFLEGFAWYAAEQGHFERVGTLQGAADVLWRKAAKEARFGIPVLHELHDRAAELARRALGADAFHRAFTEGGSLAPAAAVALALDEDLTKMPELPVRRGTPADELTPRERQVAALVAQGLTNREISEKLVVSKRTVDSHIEHILAKLGFSSRAQIAALEDGPPAPP
ncbi:ATP-binding protein [Streptomyces violens]|uniref:ATP-binding protein n=1 Tax=Streptomyces violens TaxID=66377 RepID=UPI001FE19153|nr:LuxR C-terminal-related transcriptional regulator [Streptomyces violens]